VVQVLDALRSRFDALEGTRVRALGVIEGVDHAALNRPSSPGKWSALQILHHVVTAEALSVGYVRKKMQAGPALPKAGMASRLRLLALRVTLATPIRLPAPAATATVPEAIDPAELRARWLAVRADMRDLLESMPAELADRLLFRHPLVGRLSLADTLGFMQAHLGHHLAQVRSALRR